MKKTFAILSIAGLLVCTMVLGSCKKQEKMQKENQKLIERADQEEVAEDKE